MSRIMKKALSMCLGVFFCLFAGDYSYALDPGACVNWDSGKPKECKKFDDTGRITDKSFYRQDGSLIQWLTYDPDGNIVEESYYNEDGKLGNNLIEENHWSAVRHVYVGGKLAKTRYYNKQGELIQVDAFNDFGDLTEHKLASDSVLTDKDDFIPVPERNE